MAVLEETNRPKNTLQLITNPMKIACSTFNCKAPVTQSPKYWIIRPDAPIGSGNAICPECAKNLLLSMLEREELMADLDVRAKLGELTVFVTDEAGEVAKSEIDRLAEYVATELPDEIGEGSAVDVAIDVIKKYKAQSAPVFIDNRDNPEETIKLFKCEFCPETFETPELLAAHMRIAHKKKK